MPSPSGTAGRLIRTKATRAAHLAESIYPGGLKMARHSHEPAHISIVLAGGFEEHMAPYQWDVRPGNAIFRPEEGEHAVAFGPATTRILSVTLRSRLTEYARSSKIPVGEPADMSGPRTSWLVARLQEEFRRDDPASELAVEALVLDMLVELGRRDSLDDSSTKIKKVEERIRANLHLKPSLEDLALEAGMHPVSLARAFKRVHRTTIGEYVRRLRILEATRLLMDSDLTLSEIALTLGFADQSHFCRSFKAETGLTPRRCQRAQLEG